MPPLNPNDPRPPYVQIADQIREEIKTGALRHGERMQSGRELAKRYGVAQMTARNALEVLRREGLIVSWQGRGVFVASRDAEAGGSGDSLIEAISELRAELSDLRQRVAVLEGRERQVLDGIERANLTSDAIDTM